MKDHPRFTVLFFLVFATSLNRGERINDLIAKFNERRAAGILPQPRIGRNGGVGRFGRSEGAVGLVQYPRVGRAGPPALADDLKYPEADGEVKNRWEGVDSLVDVDDQKNFDDEYRRRLANEVWLDNPRYGPGKSQQRLQCENHMDSAGIFIVTPRGDGLILLNSYKNPWKGSWLVLALRKDGASITAVLPPIFGGPISPIAQVVTPNLRKKTRDNIMGAHCPKH